MRRAVRHETAPAAAETWSPRLPWGSGSPTDLADRPQGCRVLLPVLDEEAEQHLILPAPARLDGMPTLWAAGRALIGPLLGAITVASLPEPYRRKAGLPEMPGAPTLMQGAYLTAGFTRFLPEGWINAETIIETLSLSPDSDDPRARTMTALRARMKRGAALIRLLTPLSGDSDPVPATPPSTERGGARRRSSSAKCWTRPATAISTGLTSPPWHANWPPASTWTNLRRPGFTTPSPLGGRELQAALDTDGRRPRQRRRVPNPLSHRLPPRPCNH